MPASTVYSILLRKENAHNDAIYCCSWAKTNITGNQKDQAKDFIVTGGLDCLVKVWKLENNKLELFHTLEGHTMAVVSVAVSPDGHTLVSSSLDSTLIIWDLISGKKVHVLKTGAVDVWKIAFSPDGTQILSGNHSGKLVVCGIEKGTTDRLLDTRGKFALSVDWSRDGKYIASGAVDGVVCIFDAVQGKLLHTIEAHTKPIRCVAFSPNSQSLSTASNDGKVKTYNVCSASALDTLEHPTWAVSTCYSPDGTQIATASADGGIRIALADGLKIINTFKEHTDTVWGIQFNSEGNKLLSVSKDKSINIYECPALPKNEAKK